MAIDAGTVWEVRTTGLSTNGGGFYDRVPLTSVDYSIFDVPVFSPNDLDDAFPAFTLISTGGGFTAAMQGNIIQIVTSTNNWIAGFYEIVTYTNVTTVVLDRAPCSAATTAAGTGYVGGAVSSIYDIRYPSAAVAGVVAGNTVFVKAGTYAGVGGTYGNDGTALLPIKIYGYKTDRTLTAEGDKPTGDDRPLIQSANTFKAFYILKYLRFVTDSVVRTVGADEGCLLEQVYVENTGAGACLDDVNAIAASNTVGFTCIDCWFKGASGGAQICVSSGYPRNVFIYCVFEDANTGLLSTTVFYCQIFGCVFKNCTRGHYAADVASGGTPGYQLVVCYNIFYGGSIGVRLQSDTLAGEGFHGAIIYNNIFYSNSTYGIYSLYWSPSIEDYNWFYNCGDDVHNIASGANSVTGTDPQFVAPGTDFRLQTGSPARNAGFSIRLGVG